MARRVDEGRLLVISAMCGPGSCSHSSVSMGPQACSHLVPSQPLPSSGWPGSLRHLLCICFCRGSLPCVMLFCLHLETIILLGKEAGDLTVKSSGSVKRLSEAAKGTAPRRVSTRKRGKGLEPYVYSQSASLGMTRLQCVRVA